VKPLRTLLIAVAVLFTGYTGLLIREYFRVTSGPPAPIHMSPVLDYKGTLDPTARPVRVRVYKIEKWSTGSDMQDIFNSKIEVERGAASVAFVWPQNTQFYATSAAVLDLDGDGTKELVLNNQGTEVRVLFFDGEYLHFRGQIDELASISYDVGPRSVNQRFIFVQGRAFPSQGAQDYVPLPRLVAWSKEKGFQDVTRSLNRYYAATVLPEIKATQAAQTDRQRQTLYQAAIENVERELANQN
jgi:hypothetical protein